MDQKLPRENWVEFLNSFAKSNEGKMVSLYVEAGEGERQIGENNLIAFEGDCAGEIVNGVKVVIGGEGENFENLVHYIKTPASIVYEENEEKGTIEKLALTSQNGTKTILEPVDEDLVV